MSQTPFNPAAVPITYVLDYPQVNLLLEALGKLPFEQVEELYLHMRLVAVQTIQEAQAQHQQAKAKPANLTVVPKEGDNIPPSSEWESEKPEQ